jgi:hypothetical protein
MCLAVAETAIVAIGAALVVGVAVAQRPRWLLSAPALPALGARPGAADSPRPCGAAAVAGLPAVSSSV